MSATLRRLSVCFTVRDGEDSDRVAEELEGVIQRAVAEWYERKGKDVLSCEPT